MNIGVKVEYIARDERRQKIPWIRVTDRVTGRVTEYVDTEDSLSHEEIALADKRTMDCMDCHNRPSHNYYSPDHQIDVALLTGRIDRTLPGVKKAAVEAMARDYATPEEAQEEIAGIMTRFYKERWPQVYSSRRAEVDQAILATQEAFARSIFPTMKVKWSAYPDDIGHFIDPGCMRCHDARHKSPEGSSLTRDCTACHVILSQGSGDRAQVSTSEAGLEFQHPEDIGEAWREVGCYECHSGVQP
jgi:hypothetical protein